MTSLRPVSAWLMLLTVISVNFVLTVTRYVKIELTFWIKWQYLKWQLVLRYFKYTLTGAIIEGYSKRKNNMFLLTECEGYTGEYLARGQAHFQSSQKSLISYFYHSLIFVYCNFFECETFDDKRTFGLSCVYYHKNQQTHQQCHNYQTDRSVFLHILHYRFQVSCSYNIFHFNITACFLIWSPQNGHIT